MANKAHVHDWLPAFALGTLDGEEAQHVSRHLEGCAACRAELAQYQRVAGLLPLAAPQHSAPPRVKQRLMAAVAAEQAETSPNWAQRLQAAWRALQPAYALVSLLVILALLAGNVFLFNELRRQQAAEGAAPFAQVINLEDTGAQPNGGSALLLVGADGRQATLIAQGMPSLSDELQYQFWLIDGETPLSGGLFEVTNEGYGLLTIEADQAIQDYAAFGVSIEPRGGSLAPTGDIVLYTALES